MSINEATGIVDTAGKLIAESSSALSRGDWVRALDLHDHAEAAILYVELSCMDQAVLRQVRQLSTFLKARRALTMAMLQGEAKAKGSA